MGSDRQRYVTYLQKREREKGKKDERLMSSAAKDGCPPISSHSSFSSSGVESPLDLSAYFVRITCLSVLGNFLARDARCSGEWSCY